MSKFSCTGKFGIPLHLPQDNNNPLQHKSEILQCNMSKCDPSVLFVLLSS